MKKCKIKIKTIQSISPSLNPSSFPTNAPSRAPTQHCESYNVTNIETFEQINQTAFPWHDFQGTMCVF